MKLEAGTQISHYKILSPIGKGGMGTVYLAHDTKLERKVAIKFLSKEWAKDKDKLKRFQQEAKAASALNHPNILTIYEIDETGGMPYISSEFINGTSIGTYVSEEKISLEKALDIAIQIVAALKTAHDAGIVHRDIKPENVMIRADGIVKILDFGLAKLTEKGRGSGYEGRGSDDETLITGSPGSPKTMPGMVMGTANYMSPEQARGRNVDQRADIFSFGALLYEILTRKRPFDGETTSDVIAAVLTKEPAPVTEHNADIPERLSEIVGRCLIKDKEERLQSTAHLLEELETLKKHLQIEEIEKTILPADHQRETKMFTAATTGEKAQMTTEGEAADSIVIRKSFAGKVLAAAAVTILAVAGGLLGWNYLGGETETIDAIAVMPFVNESGNKDVEYLSDGMTETLINNLSQIPGLKVKARNAVFRYKGQATDPKKIADELNVQALLYGRVLQRGDRLTLSLELINAGTENVLWGNTYEKSTSELASLQTEIARDVSNKLSARLSGEAEQKVRLTNTGSSEAYQAYLKGRYHWNKRNEEGFRKAIGFFEQAIELDPKYALAWSGLADANLLLPEYGEYPADVYLPKAKAAAEKALEYDPTLAEAQTTLAYYEHSYKWNFADAESRYKKAIELNPEYATAYQWYSELLAQEKKFDQAEVYGRKAVELDPAAPIKSYAYALTFFYKRDYPEAEKQLKKTLEIDKEFAPARDTLSQIYAIQKKLPEALRQCETMVRSEGKVWDYCEGVAYAYAGERAKAQEFLSNYTYSGAVKTYRVAAIHALIGDQDNALDLLEDLHRQKFVFLLAANTEACFDGLKNNGRFRDLIKKIGLPG